MKNDAQNDGCWYRSWFDSGYYHILYQNRDEEEALLFINNFLDFIKADNSLDILDLACGSGRYSNILAKRGHRVLGIDLSESNIERAKSKAIKGASFKVQDMIIPLPLESFDLVLNLFTSFGYFESNADNEKVIHNVYNSLKPGGVFILDFLNTNLIDQQNNQVERRIIDNIQFTITKSVQNDFIVKKIEIEDQTGKCNFEERVKLLNSTTLVSMVEHFGFKELHLFGNYTLDEFIEGESERLIIFANK